MECPYIGTESTNGSTGSEHCLAISYNIRYTLPRDSAILLPAIDPREMKTHLQKIVQEILWKLYS